MGFYGDEKEVGVKNSKKNSDFIQDRVAGSGFIFLPEKQRKKCIFKIALVIRQYKTHIPERRKTNEMISLIAPAHCLVGGSNPQ